MKIDPNVFRYKEHVATAHHMLGGVYLEVEKLNESREHIMTARDLFKELLEHRPNEPNLEFKFNNAEDGLAEIDRMTTVAIDEIAQ